MKCKGLPSSKQRFWEFWGDHRSQFQTQKSSCAIWIYKAEKEKMECKLLEDAATKKKEFENQDKFAEIERDIGVLQNSIKMAEKIIKEGNKEA